MKYTKALITACAVATACASFAATLDKHGEDISRTNFSWNSKTTDYVGSNFSDCSAVYTTFKYGADYTDATFARANLYGASFGSKSTTSNTDFTSADLRKAENLDTSGCIFKNTIMVDGSVSNFEMDSSDDVFMVYNTKDIDILLGAQNYSVSGGATFIFRLSEAASQDDPWGFGSIVGQEGTSLSFGAGTKLIFDFGTSDASIDEAYTLFENIALSGTENVSISFVANGAAVEGNFSLNSDGTATRSAVPEPSTYAAIFGLVALAFCAFRKRR